MMKQLIISEYDFDTGSNLHGLEHTQRVMHLVKHLSKVIGINSVVTEQAYCSAVIHDMARQHDGYCEMHGQWAVEKKLPVWKQRFIEFGLNEGQLESVAFAVHWHCKDSRTVPKSLHLETLRLLQDADALDRVRFGGQNGIKLDYLHFPGTIQEISYAEQLFFNW